MGARGRKSADSLAVVTTLPGQRPEPPDDLTDEQAAEWRAVVGRLPAEWFPRETHPMLAAYCRHVVAMRVLSARLDAFDPEWLANDDGLDRYDKLLKLREREGRAMSSLATRMRLTQQSRYKAEAAESASKRGSVGKKPWES